MEVETFLSNPWNAPQPSLKGGVAVTWGNWLLLPLSSPTRRTSSAPDAIVRVEPNALSWSAPIAISSPLAKPVVTVPMTVRVVPTETLPVSTQAALRPRKARIFASAFTVFAACWFIIQTEYAWFAAPAVSRATRIR